MPERYIIDGKEHVYESDAEKHLTDKSVTLNGTYKAEDEPGDINGYKNVTVNVEGGGSATLIPKTITENGEYNASEDEADGYSKVVVNIPSPGAAFVEVKNAIVLPVSTNTVIHAEEVIS